MQLRLTRRRQTHRRSCRGSGGVDRTLVISLTIFLCQLCWSLVAAQPPQASETCLLAMRQCESSIDCVHRLAALQASCVTNTCQPQCRESAMNLYQNREGRQLLRTDVSCVPGRYELEKCGLLPNRPTKHCIFAKLICESDLECNATWEVYASECDAETADGRCSDKCVKHLNTTISTRSGASLANCTCTTRDDGVCEIVKQVRLETCLRKPLQQHSHGGSKSDERDENRTRPSGLGAGEHGNRVDDEQFSEGAIPSGGGTTTMTPPPSAETTPDSANVRPAADALFLFLLSSALLVAFAQKWLLE